MVQGNMGTEHGTCILGREGLGVLGFKICLGICESIGGDERFTRNLLLNNSRHVTWEV